MPILYTRIDGMVQMFSKMSAFLKYRHNFPTLEVQVFEIVRRQVIVENICGKILRDPVPQIDADDSDPGIFCAFFGVAWKSGYSVAGAFL